MGKVNVADPNGVVTTVDADALPGYIAQGWRVEGSDERADRVATDARVATTSSAEALAAGALRSVTFGGSDAALSAIYGPDATIKLKQYKEAHPLTNAAGEVGGALLDPLGAYGAISNTVRGAEGVTAAARIAKTAAAGAAEGAAYGAGSYVSDVALGDRDLSADGFMGAMGKGALWGGVAGGALSLGSEGLASARKMFPREEVTAEAVARAEREATQGISDHVQDSQQLEAIGQRRLKEIREDMAAANPSFRQELEAIEAERRAFQTRAVEQADRASGALPETTGIAEDDLEQYMRDAVNGKRAPRRAFAADDIDLPTPTPRGPAADLEEQLRGTRNALDQGQSIGTLSHRAPVEDIDGAIARRQPAPSEAEADAMLAGDDRFAPSTRRVDQFTAAHSPEAKEILASIEQLKASRTDLGELLDARAPSVGKRVDHLARPDSAAIEGPEGPVTAADIVNAEPAPGERPDLDHHVQSALRHKADDFGADLNESAATIGKYEQAHADLTEKLGSEAPPTSVERAKGFREAQRTAADRTGQATADTATALADAHAAGPLQTLKSLKGHPLAKTLDKAGQVYEALRMMGLPVPDPHSIPVVGPLLSMYLKARIGMKVVKRLGFGVERTAETAIATKAAQTQQRVFRAVDSMLDGGSKALARGAEVAPLPTAALGHVLFDDGAPSKRKPYSAKPSDGDLPAMYLARADELNRASRPGAIADAVRARVQTSDPSILSAIIAAQTRKLGFLNEKLPRPDLPPSLLAPDKPWIPPRSDLARFGRYIEASEDPAHVLEQAAAGRSVPVEHIEALSRVYPQLYMSAQKRLVTQLSTRKPASIPHKMRQQMSTVFGLPLDTTSAPGFGAFLQQGYQSTPQQPSPGTGGSIGVDGRTGTSFDSRGG